MKERKKKIRERGKYTYEYGLGFFFFSNPLGNLLRDSEEYGFCTEKNKNKEKEESCSKVRREFF